MGKEDRRRVVLDFLCDYDLVLPPRTIYNNLKLKENVTFSYKSTRNYLREFADEGLVVRLEPKPLAAGERVEPSDEGDSRAYYEITEKGKEYTRD